VTSPPKLRRAVRVVNAELSGLGLEKHPEKTLIGKTESGFDLLGYHFSREGLGVTKKTIPNFVKRPGGGAHVSR